MGGTLPLLVECSCSSDVANCGISTLTLELTIEEIFSGTPTISATHTLTILANPSDPGAPSMTLDVTPGDYSIDLPLLDWGPLWNTITVQLTTESSSNQVPSPPFSAYDQFRATYSIVQHYACLNVDTTVDSGWNVNAYTLRADAATECNPGEVRVLCYAGHGVNSIFYKSTPLGACQGCTIADHNFQPGIQSTANVDPANSATICICATGGSGNYQYSIIDGNLPGGVTLNASTGCFEGAPDKSRAGSPTITFRVTDLGGAGAPVGSTVTVGGTGYVDGTQFIWASGAAFFPAMEGTTITVNGSPRTVVAYNSPYYLTLS